MGYMLRHSSPSALSGVTDVVLAAKSVIEDPCLYETAGLLLRLNQLEKKPPAPATAPTTKGIGLCKAVPILKKVVYVRERPWILPVAVIGIVGGLFAAGYLTGKGRRR